MMSIQTKFSIDEIVWDTILKKKLKIIGIETKSGKRCCSDVSEHYVRYYLNDHLCNTYRLENELEKDWNDTF